MIKARKHYRNVRTMFLVVQTGITLFITPCRRLLFNYSLGIRAALARKQFAKAVAEEKARKQRLVEIQAREKNDAERAKKDREAEEERQRKEITDKVCSTFIPYHHTTNLSLYRLRRTSESKPKRSNE